MYPNKMGPLQVSSNLPLSLEHWNALRATCEGRGHQATGVCPTAWGPIDRALPGQGLGVAKVHEWIGTGQGGQPGRHTHARSTWLPPLSILTHLARQAAGIGRGGGGLVLWVGEAVWPFPAALVDHAADPLLSRSIFVRAACAGERLWAADLALRSSAAAAVIADGSRLDLSATRRLQLAAEAGGGICFLARPPWERSELSAAATRWSIRVAPTDPRSSHHTRRWTVELLRCKGVQPTAAALRCWTLEHDRATRHGLVVSELLDRPGEAAPLPRRRSG